jgi:hypothetical protein
MWSINAWRERTARSRLDNLRIESLRFRRLLENSRSLFDLFSDGEEKSGGDYIIDMHYVTSLVDQAMERAGRLVFDACVLVPGAGTVLFSLLDEQRETADALHLASRNRQPAAAVGESGSETPEPEYRLLSQVLDWFRGPTEKCGGRQPMIRLLQTALDQVMAQSGFPDVPHRCLRKLPLSGHEVGVVFTEDQPGLARQREVSLAEVNCRPLGLMVEGSEVEARSEGRRAKGGNWLAVVGGSCLSLRSGNEGAENVLRVEAMVSGHVDSDFVFLYVGRRHDLYDTPPVGLSIEETTLGRMGWAYDVPEKELEEALIRVGRAVFEQESEGALLGPKG